MKKNTTLTESSANMAIEYPLSRKQQEINSKLSRNEA